jgi:hypothetical protein
MSISEATAIAGKDTRRKGEVPAEGLDTRVVITSAYPDSLDTNLMVH